MFTLIIEEQEASPKPEWHLLEQEDGKTLFAWHFTSRDPLVKQVQKLLHDREATNWVNRVEATRYPLHEEVLT